MTEIQAQTIPHLLEGRDLVGAAKTGKYTLIYAMLVTQNFEIIACFTTVYPHTY